MSHKSRKSTLEVGDTFVAEMGSESPHLWIVVAIDKPQAVIVNLTSLRDHYDALSIFKRGEHPWIKHDSVAYYAGMRDVEILKILRFLNDGTFESRTKASPMLISRLQEEAACSSLTPIRLQSLFKSLVEKRRVPASASELRSER